MKWADAADEKIPPRFPSGELKNTKGVYVRKVAWVYKPQLSNLFCLFVSGHFGIEVKFPDNQKFFFDYGNWGGVFQEKDIRSYAR